MDERVGRQMAADLGITVVGVLGILLESYRRRSISDPRQLLEQLQKSGFRVSRRLLAEFELQIANIRV